MVTRGRGAWWVAVALALVAPGGLLLLAVWWWQARPRGGWHGGTAPSRLVLRPSDGAAATPCYPKARCAT